MSSPSNAYILIRKWLSQRLSFDEKETLKKQWTDNDAFIEEVANEVVKEYGRIELKKKLEAFHIKDIEQTKNSSAEPRSFPYWWAIAASIVVMLPLGYWLFFSQPSTEKLFADHFEAYQNLNTFRGEEQPIDKAMDLYSSGRYPEAINAMENALANDAYNLPQYYFYLGVSYLANNNPDKALTYFQKTVATDSDFKQQANWYMALTYLKKKDKTQAKKIFNEISSSQGAYKQKEATEILKGL